jgi:hypothetical protein
MAATRDDWKITPLATARAAIACDRTYSAGEMKTLEQGYVPHDMDDKWFAFFEEPWLFLHRSWTGFGIFQVRFEDGRVAEAWVSRDPEQYTSTDDTGDSLLLALVLDGFAGRDTTEAMEKYGAWPG